MKVAKALAIFSFFSILLGSCFETPDFPDTPQIGYVDIAYFKVPKPFAERKDSLVLTINFQDGDGDIGLDAQINTEPFNPVFYYQTNAAGELVPIVPSQEEVTLVNKRVTPPKPYEVTLDVFNVNSSTDDLVFSRTIDNPLYSDLPPFQPRPCVNYETRKQFMVRYADREVLHEFSQIDTTLTVDTVKYLVVTDTVYFTLNPNHNNIEVDFFVQSGNEFVEYDMWQESCTTVDGRFPELSSNDAALEGTLTYGMTSQLGFATFFQNKQMYLKIKVRDRALNESNPIQTPVFTLH